MTKEIKKLPKENELITDKIMVRLKQLGRQRTYDPIVIARLYKPCCKGAFYLTDYKEENDTITLYFLGKIARSDRWRFSSVTQLQKYRCKLHGLPLQRDLTFTERHFEDLLNEKRVYFIEEL